MSPLTTEASLETISRMLDELDELDGLDRQ